MLEEVLDPGVGHDRDSGGGKARMEGDILRRTHFMVQDYSKDDVNKCLQQVTGSRGEDSERRSF